MPGGGYLIFRGTGMMMKQGWVFEDQMLLNGWVWASKMFLKGWVLKRKCSFKGLIFQNFRLRRQIFPKIYTKSILRVTMMLLNGSIFGKTFLNGWALQLKMFPNGWVSKSQESSYPGRCDMQKDQNHVSSTTI